MKIAAAQIACVLGDFNANLRKISDFAALAKKSGEELAKYRKTHLVTAAPLDERVCLLPGNDFVSCKVRKFTVGLSICYDLRFPEMARTLVVKHDANVIVNSSAWPVVRAEHLRILALARAVENQSYFIIANRVGTDDGVTLCGSSVIVDPSGAILAAAAPDREELIQAEISEQAIADVRNRVPVFAHRRSELYKLG